MVVGVLVVVIVIVVSGAPAGWRLAPAAALAVGRPGAVLVVLHGRGPESGLVTSEDSRLTNGHAKSKLWGSGGDGESASGALPTEGTEVPVPRDGDNSGRRQTSRWPTCRSPRMNYTEKQVLGINRARMQAMYSAVWIVILRAEGHILESAP